MRPTVYLLKAHAALFITAHLTHLAFVCNTNLPYAQHKPLVSISWKRQVLHIHNASLYTFQCSLRVTLHPCVQSNAP